MYILIRISHQTRLGNQCFGTFYAESALTIPLTPVAQPSPHSPSSASRSFPSPSSLFRLIFSHITYIWSASKHSQCRKYDRTPPKLGSPDFYYKDCNSTEVCTSILSSTASPYPTAWQVQGCLSFSIATSQPARNLFTTPTLSCDWICREDRDSCCRRDSILSHANPCINWGHNQSDSYS